METPGREGIRSLAASGQPRSNRRTADRQLLPSAPGESPVKDGALLLSGRRPTPKAGRKARSRAAVLRGSKLARRLRGVPEPRRSDLNGIARRERQETCFDPRLSQGANDPPSGCRPAFVGGASFRQPGSCPPERVERFITRHRATGVHLSRCARGARKRSNGPPQQSRVWPRGEGSSGSKGLEQGRGHARRSDLPALDTSIGQEAP